MTSIKDCAYFDPSKASEEEEEEEEEEEAALEAEEGAVEDEDNAQEQEESANKEVPVPEVSPWLLLCWFMNNVYSAKKVFVIFGVEWYMGCGVKEFFFEFSARYWAEHKKINSISPRNELFCLLYKLLTIKRKQT